MNHNAAVGSFLRVILTNESWYGVKESERSVIETAVKRYVERGIDELLELDLRDGEVLTVAASGIFCFYVSTPEGREQSIREMAQDTKWEREIRLEIDPGA